MAKRTSVKGLQTSLIAAEKKAVKNHDHVTSRKTRDSFQSFGLKLGMGTDNALSGSTYGFNPITRNRTLLEWIHRGSWLGGVAVDLVAEDMTRGGSEFMSQMDPDSEELLLQAETRLGLWAALRDTVAWGRLYGGAIMVPLIDGQDLSTPLRVESVGKGQLKGFLSFDRWMVEPSLDNLVNEPGPRYGEPMFYTINNLAPGLRGQKVHYTRTMRFVGIKLPYWQSVMENLWGISVYERLYDRMVAFDSATTGAAQSVYKSYLRVLAIDGMREAIGAGGDQEVGLIKFTEFMAKFQSIEGVTLIDAKDKFEGHTNSSFAGISDCLLQFGQQLSGALQIPLVRLFGQSPAGLNSSGDSDLRTYYDGILAQQNKMKEPMRGFYICMIRSEGIKVPATFDFKFKSLWQLTEEQKSEIASRDAETANKPFESGLVDQPTALKELRQSSRVTGRWTNISDEDIKAAEAMPVDPAALATLAEDKQDPKPEGEVETSRQKAQDHALTPWVDIHGMPITIEHRAGETRFGHQLTADYGYIRRTGSAEGADEQMDCFIGPLGPADAAPVFVIDGYWPDGGFDEHKIMFGFRNAEAARRAYASYYSDRSPRNISQVDPAALKTWMAEPANVAKPFA